MDTVYRKTKWLRFIIVDKKPKTVVMDVLNTTNENLGQISWYGSWRQYVFVTRSGSFIFNNGCLKDIEGVLTSLNTEHKERK